MPEETLEQVRLLSNLESNRHKLLQIVLFGQPELDATLAKPGLRQLRDRITHSFRMRPLSKPEVAQATWRFACARPATAARTSSRRARSRLIAARRRTGSRGASTSSPTRRCSSAFTENGHAVTDAPRARGGRRLGIRRSARRAAERARSPSAARPSSSALRSVPRCSGCGTPTPQPAVAAVGARTRRPRPSPRPSPRPRPLADGRAETLRHRRGRAERRRRTSARSRRGGSSAIRRPAKACSPSASRPRASCSTAPPDEVTRSSSSSPTTATRRGWSGSCPRARDLVPLEELFVIPMASSRRPSPARHVRRIPDPRRRPRGRTAPSAAVPAGLPDRAAQLWRAAQANLKAGKNPA